MTKIKKFAAAIVAAVSIGAIGVGAYAASDQLPDYYSFTFKGYGGAEFSPGEEKDNNEDYALVDIENGYLSSTAYVYLAVFKAQTATSAITNSYLATKVGGDRIKLNYTQQRGAGSINYLGATGSYYGSQLSGHWQP